MSKHIVIAAYILLICTVSVVLVFSRILLVRNRGLYGRVSLLCGVMLLRLGVKFVYFYVEFYISSWHLNVLINLAMDATYVLSVALVFSLLEYLTGAGFQNRTLVMIMAGACYVMIFFSVASFSISPVTNHDFVIEDAGARLIYFLNELFFFLATAVYSIKYLRHALRTREKLPPVAALCGTGFLYVGWVFLWDVSFVIPLLHVLRHTKPVDGVLFFTLVLCVAFFRFSAADLRALLNKTEVSPVRSEPEEQMIESFVARVGLTARETEVLLLVFRGHSNTDVARTLNISENTVKRHLSNIFGKAGVKNRFELIHAVSRPC